ncbi:MAG TPA: hypothetical protein PLD27_10845 [bacterium]|nr:hypothetical protein [bacterium]HOL48119.1 hypothetical protein [bacterium]HPQ19724.1 hypothetical protein [bacterium]
MKKNFEHYNTILYELRKIAGENNYKIKLTKDIKRIGGYCRYKDRHIIVVNSSLPEKEQLLFIIDELIERKKDIFLKEKLNQKLLNFLVENNYKILKEEKEGSN